MPYFFASSISGSSVSISGADARHLAGPLRARPGEVISVLDPDGGRVLSVRLGSVSRSLVVGEVVAAEAHAPETSLRVCMCLALLPAPALEESLARCTELGAWSFLLIAAERSVARSVARSTARSTARSVARSVARSSGGSGAVSRSGSRSGRWESICREAAMLAGRFRVPPVEGPVAFSAALERFAPGSAWVLDGRASQRLGDSVGGPQPGGAAGQLGGVSLGVSGGQLGLFIGPEGGWSEGEIGLAGERLRRLGARNLRAPNAAAAALTLVLAASGDM